MKMSEALHTYNKLYRKFLYEHVFYIVKGEQKWTENPREQRLALVVNQEIGPKYLNQGISSSGADVGASEEGEEVRPMGRKANPTRKMSIFFCPFLFTPTSIFNVIKRFTIIRLQIIMD